MELYTEDFNVVQLRNVITLSVTATLLFQSILSSRLVSKKRKD